MRQGPIFIDRAFIEMSVTEKFLTEYDPVLVKLFENHGKGIGEKGKNNGLLILLFLAISGTLV